MKSKKPAKSKTTRQSPRLTRLIFRFIPALAGNTTVDVSVTALGSET
jgi:hypothetical protein